MSLRETRRAATERHAELTGRNADPHREATDHATRNAEPVGTAVGVFDESQVRPEDPAVFENDLINSGDASRLDDDDSLSHDDRPDGDSRDDRIETDLGDERERGREDPGNTDSREFPN